MQLLKARVYLAGRTSSLESGDFLVFFALLLLLSVLLKQSLFLFLLIIINQSFSLDCESTGPT